MHNIPVLAFHVGKILSSLRSRRLEESLRRPIWCEGFGFWGQMLNQYKTESFRVVLRVKNETI